MLSCAKHGRAGNHRRIHENGVAFLLTAIILGLLVLTSAAYGPPVEDWAKRSVMQVLTDRFALPDCPAKPRRCKDLMNACGGTHVGLRQHLDYIQVRGSSLSCFH